MADVPQRNFAQRGELKLDLSPDGRVLILDVAAIAQEPKGPCIVRLVLDLSEVTAMTNRLQDLASRAKPN